MKVYADISNELTERIIDFKIYVSINPAHFLTMSNPKRDTRGSTMVSCHSFNSTEYGYNCGCSGYARDKYTFIAFTVSDEDNPETFNNRKTSRQIFAYKPNNGVLLQSRMYITKSGDSYGGVDGETPEGKAYRDLIQREIAALESAPNLWEVDEYFRNKFAIELNEGKSFGGYADWTYREMGATISVRTDHAEDFEEFRIGTYGLCIRCGEMISEGLYCKNGEGCDESDSVTCEYCNSTCEETFTVNYHGSEIEVCARCREESFVECPHCGEYYHLDDVIWVADGDPVCQYCLDLHYTYCEECHEYYDSDCVHEAIDRHGERVYICENCAESYVLCDYCESVYVHERSVIEAEGENGETVYLCPECAEDAAEFVTCENCGRHIHSSRANEIEDSDGNTIFLCADCATDEEGESA